MRGRTGSKFHHYKYFWANLRSIFPIQIFLSCRSNQFLQLSLKKLFIVFLIFFQVKNIPTDAAEIGAKRITGKLGLVLKKKIQPHYQ